MNKKHRFLLAPVLFPASFFAVYRPPMQPSNNNVDTVQFGFGTDKPIPAAFQQ